MRLTQQKEVTEVGSVKCLTVQVYWKEDGFGLGRG